MFGMLALMGVLCTTSSAFALRGGGDNSDYVLRKEVNRRRLAVTWKPVKARYQSKPCTVDDCQVSVGCGKGEVPISCEAHVAKGGNAVILYFVFVFVGSLLGLVFELNILNFDLFLDCLIPTIFYFDCF